MITALKKLFGSEKKTAQPVPEPVVHRASMPREPVVGIFIPIRDFQGRDNAGELLGSYMKGRIYYLRKGNDMLAGLCTRWEKEGLILIKMR